MTFHAVPNYWGAGYADEDRNDRYGFTIPGYFAYDDVAVRFDK